MQLLIPMPEISYRYFYTWYDYRVIFVLKISAKKLSSQ